MKRFAILLLILPFLGAVVHAQTGCVSGNCENGYGTYRWSNGDVYEGAWRYGDRHGWGTYLYHDGGGYSGCWKSGNKHYFGARFWESGDFYLGLYQDGDRQDHGLYVHDSGNPEYEVKATYFSERGCVLGDCEDGFGVYIWDDGDLYAGFWKDGRQHYWGAKFWNEYGNADFYIGLYKSSVRQDHGLYVYEDASPGFKVDPTYYSERGCVSGNCEDGIGLYIWSDGDVHAGVWKDGDQHYWGAMFWNEYGNADFYQGMFRNGDRQDRGLYVYENATPKFEVEALSYLDRRELTANSTIHFILFTDTDDSRVGTSCEETNKYFRNTFVPKLERYSGMQVRTYYRSGSSYFNLSDLNRTIANLSTGSNDVIFFYYAGHGYNRGYSDFPTITLGRSGESIASRQKDLIDVYTTLQRKPHRLLLVMAEACNKVYARRNDMRVSNIVNNFALYQDESRHIKELFVQSRGDYLMSSSGKNQLSHLASGQPGFFTCSFRDAFAHYVDMGYSGTATWGKIFNQTKSNTRSNAEQIGEVQVPQWCEGDYCN
ncbi:MAG: caspase family protein [Bacteroidota bacterium]